VTQSGFLAPRVVLLAIPPLGPFTRKQNKSIPQKKKKTVLTSKTHILFEVKMLKHFHSIFYPVLMETESINGDADM
jgi:hypothetical protein